MCNLFLFEHQEQLVHSGSDYTKRWREGFWISEAAQRRVPSRSLDPAIPIGAVGGHIGREIVVPGPDQQVTGQIFHFFREIFGRSWHGA